MSNKERVVERILDDRYHMNGRLFPMAQSRERQVLIQRDPNLMNIPMNRSPVPNTNDSNPQILRSVLSFGSEPQMSSPYTTNTSFLPNNYDLCCERQLNIQNNGENHYFNSFIKNEQGKLAGFAFRRQEESELECDTVKPPICVVKRLIHMLID